MRGSNPDFIKALVRIVDERRGRRMTVYTGDYVDIPVSPKEYIIYKITTLLLIFLIAILFFGAGYLNNPGMFETSVVISYVAAVFSFIFFCITFFQLPWKKDRFRLGEVGLLFGRLKMASIFLGISIVACVLGEAFFLSNIPIENRQRLDIVFLAMMVGTFSLTFLLNRIQNRIEKKSSIK